MPADGALKRRTSPRWLAGCAMLFAYGAAVAQTPEGPPSALQLAQRLSQSTFSSMGAGPVAAPWRIVGLPKQTLPLTRFDVVLDAGTAVVRVVANGAYGNLAFDTGGARLSPQTVLRWRWRLEQGLEGSDLRRKQGDDTPVKVCALFDMDLAGMSFGEQSRLRFARAMTGEPLPAATLCYVWDRLLPVGTELPNVFSARVRYVVASSGPARPGRWLELERRPGADFLRAFGHESREIPALIALVVGADADNTGGHSLAFVGDLALVPHLP
jgi:hypothetical protein